MMARRSVSALAVLALLPLSLAVPSALSAQETRFQGSTEGCFGEACEAVGESYFLGQNILHFRGSTFDAWTTGQTLDFTGPELHFGYFWWESFALPRLIDSPFSLAIDFTLPQGVSPDARYSGNVSGVVMVRGFFNVSPFSTVGLEFTPNQRTFTFTGGEPDAPGGFTLTLNDVYIAPSGRSYITGRIDATVTPEPFTLALLGTGLAGVGAAARRRKRRA